MSNDTTVHDMENDSHPLMPAVIAGLKNIYDPEIPVNIYDLGLIYAVQIDDQAKVHIDMTLTAPGCPVAQTFPGQVEATILGIDEVRDCHVNLTWDPPWTQERMSEIAKVQLGWI